MSDFRVKELMVPLSEYATVPKGSTLFEAVLALEKAQEEFDHTKYKHRGVLILDKKKRVIGKLGQLDVLRALEPKEENPGEIERTQPIRLQLQFCPQTTQAAATEHGPLEGSLQHSLQIKGGGFHADAF